MVGLITCNDCMMVQIRLGALINKFGGNIMFKSETYGDLELKDIPQCMLDYYNKMVKYNAPMHIIIGTDSQNFSDTKMVSVIAYLCEGHGGIYFYEISRIAKIKDVRTKLHCETNESLNIATKLLELLEEDSYKDIFLSSTFAIHVDAGNSEIGKTKELIPELVGWIKSCGYDCSVKPDSFVASSIADKISK